MKFLVRSTRITTPSLEQSIRWLPIVVLLPFPIVFGFVAVFRFWSPIGLEWNEGHSLEQSLRFARGEPLYPAPDSGWIPYMYAPLYHWLWGTLIALTGSTHLALGRLISIIAIIATTAAVAFGTWKNTHSPTAAVLSTCLLFAFFGPSGYWFDLARVDSLASALALWGLVLIPSTKQPSGNAAAAWLLLGLSILAKQSMAPVAILGWGVIALRTPRLAGILTVATAFASASLLLLMQRTGNDWFFFWVFDAPRHHASDWSSIFWPRQPGISPRVWSEFLAPALIPFVIAGWRIARFRIEPLRSEEVMLLGAFALATLAGLVGLAKYGGYRNNLMPSFCLIALFVGISLPHLGDRPRISVIVAVLFIVQIWQPWGGNRWLLDPRSQLPHAEAAESMGRLGEWLADRHQANEPVLILHHQWISAEHGHPQAYNNDMVRVAQWAGVATPWEALQPLAIREYEWIILDQELEDEWLPPGFQALIRQYYNFAGSLESVVHVREQTLRPVTGAPMNARYVWRLSYPSEDGN